MRSFRPNAKATPMSNLTEDEILEKAKELWWSGGKAWSLDDFQNRVPGVTMLTKVADATERLLYLSRAKAMLNQDSRRPRGFYPILTDPPGLSKIAHRCHDYDRQG
jgi:hypothetical protein